MLFKGSFFSGIGISERPDTVCGKITEGRIAVLVDGVPSALIVPYLFAEYFQTLDDYSNRAYFATFTRILKFCAFFISMLLPGVYVALGTFNPEMFPTLMLNKIAVSIGSTPLSLMSETILIQFVYEMMRRIIKNPSLHFETMVIGEVSRTEVCICYLKGAVLVNICGKNSFGVPYTTPITPFSAVAVRDVLIRAGWKILSKKTAKVQNLPGADVR